MSVDLNALGKGIHRHIQEQDFQFGVQDERERIIKLLEDFKCDDGKRGKKCQHNLCCSRYDVIALIKGESNE